MGKGKRENGKGGLFASHFRPVCTAAQEERAIVQGFCPRKAKVQNTWI